MLAKNDFLEKYNISTSEFKKTKLKWSDLEDIYNDYEAKRNDFEPTLKYIVDKLLTNKNVHSVKYRIKNSEHLIEKIIRKKIENKRKRFTLANYQSKFDDIIGVRVLHLFKDDWIDIDKEINNEFKVKGTPIANIRIGDLNQFKKKYSDKEYVINEHDFGYRSVHYIIKDIVSKKSHTAEIQVRTLFEEGWSEIDHLIRYPYFKNNPIMEGYLLMLNRLVGSADEMGNFINFLKDELDKRDAKIDELKAQIQELEVDESQRNHLSSSLEDLLLKPTYDPLYFNTNSKIDFGTNIEISNSITGLNYLSNNLYLTKTCKSCNREFTNDFYTYSELCDDCRNGLIKIN